MKPLIFIKRMFSTIARRKVEIGYGFSSDNTFHLPVGTDVNKLNPNDTGRGFYKLRPIPGPFEFVGHVTPKVTEPGKKIEVLFQLRHKYTGETFNVSRNMLDFLFEKYDL